jgi:Putative glycosyl/glycerophosphate transferases involved in teichoic acid biosynthesis TagF/TagB/EpsJ/RodC
VIGELLTRGRRVLQVALPSLLGWLALLAAALLVLLAPGLATAVVALAVILGYWLATARGRIALGVAPGVALAVALASARAAGSSWSWPLASTLAVVLLLAFAVPSLHSLLRPPVRSLRLPVPNPWFDAVPDPARLALMIALSLLAVSAGGLLPDGALLAGVLLLAAAAVVLSALHLWALRDHRPERALAAALAPLAPRYLIYYAGPSQGAYQLQMWLPHLAAIGEPAAMLVRDPEFLATAAALTELPVLQADSVEAMEYLMVPSLRAVFYVNNDARNADGVRFARLRHVFLGHGDSDKPSSWSAMAGIYDQIFVAGQAGVDRYRDHGVLIPEAKFVKVGRPQLAASLDAVTGGSPAPRTVLYAPTWRGGLDDMQLGSLRHGVELVTALLEAGVRVIFRPHPLSFRDAESRVLIGRIDAIIAARADGGLTSAQASALSIAECMNRSDAMAADISSVVSDYLFTNKPFAVLVEAGKAELIAESPLAGAATVVNLGSDLAPQLTDLLGEDAHEHSRRLARSYYLGDGSGTAREDAFSTAIRSALGQKP